MLKNAVRQLCFVNPKQVICTSECPDTNIINSLISSYSLSGVFSPLCILKQEDRYLLISDSLPYFAAIKMNMVKVPAIIFPNNSSAEIVSLIYAYFYEKKDTFKLIESVKDLSKKYSASDISLNSGIPVKDIENYLFLGTLSKSTVRAIVLTEIDVSFAKALDYLQDNCKLAGAEVIKEQNLSVYSAEKMFSHINDKKPESKTVKPYDVKDVRFYVNSLLKIADLMKNKGMCRVDTKKTENGIDLTLHISES